MKHFQYSAEELAEVRARSRELAKIIDRVGPIRRELIPDLFESIVRNIVAQQIAGTAYEAIWARVRKLIGNKISPEKILKTVPADLKSCGLSDRKVQYIFNLARRVRSREIDLEAIKKMSDADAISALTKLDGIGVWTAEMLLIFTLNRKNIFSFGDFGIREGMKKVFGIDEISREVFERFREQFSPFCSLASFYLWVANVPAKHAFYYDSLLGTLTLVEQNGALLQLHIGKICLPESEILASVRGNEILETVVNWLDKYFAGTRVELPKIKFRPAGTPFQISVWRELKKIKYGRTTTYGEIAQKLAAARGGNAKMSAQAVGQAVGKNPLEIIFPCHRVLGANRKITGFSGGLDLKRKLLAIEESDFVE